MLSGQHPALLEQPGRVQRDRSRRCEFQSNLLISLKLTERATGKRAVPEPGAARRPPTSARSPAPSSPRRRASRTTPINARDLVDFTNVQIGESRRRDGGATSWSTQAARDVYLYTVEAF